MTDTPTQKPALRKPEFVKIKDLERGRSGFNVYVQVVEANERLVDTRDGEKIKMVDAVVADETGAAKAFFKGESAKDIKKGAVVAIRNGVKKIIKGHISLEIDIFGRVTVEDVKITPDTKLNISDAEIAFEPRKDRPRKPRFGGRRTGGRNEGSRNDRPRRDNGDRPPRGDRQPREDRPERGERQPRRDNEDRPPRRDREDRGDRGPRGDNENRPPRRDREDRPPRRDREDRGPRRDREEGAPRRDYDNRPPRRDRDEGAPRRDRDEGAPRRDREDRGPRRDYDNKGPREDRKPRNNDRDYDRGNNSRTEGGNRGQQQRTEGRFQEKRGDRRPMVKISEIGPGEDNIRFIAKVIEATVISGRNGSNVRCVLGDETGIVNAFIPETEFIKVGRTIALFGAEARVVKEHIQIQRARTEEARNPIDRVKDSFNLSEKAWVPVD